MLVVTTLHGWTYYRTVEGNYRLNYMFQRPLTDVIRTFI